MKEHVINRIESVKKITGAFPLVTNDRVVDYLLKGVNGKEEALVEKGESLAMAPMGRNEFVVGLTVRLDGDKPIKAPIIDMVVSVLDELYDKTKVDVPGVKGDISPEEEDAVLEYVAWLRGGYVTTNDDAVLCLNLDEDTVDGEIVPFVKPDKNDLIVAATAIKKMVKARA